MPLEGFLLSCDETVIRSLKPAWHGVGGSELVVSNDPNSAAKVLTRKHFDAVLVDCDLPGAQTVMEAVRGAKSNQRSIAFVISKISAPGMVVQFILQKPLTTEYAARAFKAAYAMMAQEHRRYFRIDVNLPVFLMVNNLETKVTMEDLSAGGMAVRTSNPLAATSIAKFRFRLQDSDEIRGGAEVVWSMSQKAGLKFSAFEGDSQKKLEQWLLKKEV